jgi:3-phosphoshikimate 1-carboxyvinyltransferase
MKTYEVQPLKRNMQYTVSVPGSKSITNRALLFAALSNTNVTITGVLFSDDSRYFLSSLTSLGFDIKIDEEKKTVEVAGCGGEIPNKEAKIYVGSAGTAARFLTCMCGLSDGKYVVDASKQMQKRPMKPLMDALISLGAKITYLGEEGHLPICITGCGAKNDASVVELDISSSTQFLSALLMCGMMSKNGMDINITSSKKYGSYIEVTLKMIDQFGGKVEFDGSSYHINSNSHYEISYYQVEPDVSAACYFFGIAAITSSRVLVKDIKENSMQGDINFLNVLRDMGCIITYTKDGVIVEGPSEQLKGIDIDMNNFSDQAMTLAAISVFAKSTTTIRGIGHIRVQESDRLSAIISELTRMGIKTEYGQDYIVIYPGQIKPAAINTYEDHRMAMAFTLCGLVTEGIVINDPMCCKKTFENYFEIIDSLHFA